MAFGLDAPGCWCCPGAMGLRELRPAAAAASATRPQPVPAAGLPSKTRTAPILRTAAAAIQESQLAWHQWAVPAAAATAVPEAAATASSAAASAAKPASAAEALAADEAAEPTAVPSTQGTKLAPQAGAKERAGTTDSFLQFTDRQIPQDC